MKTKTAISLVLILLAIVNIPLSFAARFMLYRHIQAPPELWLLFWIDIPLMIISLTVSNIFKSIDKKDSNE